MIPSILLVGDMGKKLFSSGFSDFGWIESGLQIGLLALEQYSMMGWLQKIFRRRKAFRAKKIMKIWLAFYQM